MTDTADEQPQNTTNDSVAEATSNTVAAAVAAAVAEAADETDPLVDSLSDIAKSGSVETQWPDLQKSLRIRLEQVIEMYQNQKDSKENQLDEPNVEKFNLDSSRDEIVELIDSFAEPPFTIQRICELLSWPLKYYDRVSTFLRGLEKNLRVISSNDWPKCQPPYSPKVQEAIT